MLRRPIQNRKSSARGDQADERIKEGVMQQIETTASGAGRLRFVFEDAVVSFSLAAEATFGEIAQKLAEISNRHPGDPVAIDVTLGDAGK